MDQLDDRAVIVSARSLDDVLELARRAQERFDPTDPLAMALRGAIAQMRQDAIPEP